MTNCGIRQTHRRCPAPVCSLGLFSAAPSLQAVFVNSALPPAIHQQSRNLFNACNYSLPNLIFKKVMLIKVQPVQHCGGGISWSGNLRGWVSCASRDSSGDAAVLLALSSRLGTVRGRAGTQPRGAGVGRGLREGRNQRGSFCRPPRLGCSVPDGVWEGGGDSPKAWVGPCEAAIAFERSWPPKDAYL